MLTAPSLCFLKGWACIKQHQPEAWRETSILNTCKGEGHGAGDWFNRLDLSLQSNNYGVGLPPREKNEASWALKRELLATPALKPSPAQV